MDDDFGRLVGRALRGLRKERDLTLRELATLSEGRFTATGVAGYERGERAISLARFSDLVRLYGDSPDRVLRDVLRAGRPDAPRMDLDVLDDLPAEEARLVRWFVEDVMELRGREAGDAMSIRVGELEILTSSTERSAADLLERIASALRALERRSTPSPPA